MNYKKALLKRRLEELGMFPFVLLGKFYGLLFPLKSPTKTFMFFSSADIGGATRVNADILNCIAEQNPLVVFSKKPKNNGHASLFENYHVLDLNERIDNKIFHFVNFFYRGVLASWINKTENPVVFGGECLFFYKVIPHIKKQARILELCHLPTWFNYTIGFVDLIDSRIFSSLKLKQDTEAIYRKNHLPESLYERLFFIENKIDIPEYEEHNNEILQVVYIGRGAPQKRVPLIAGIARRMFERKASVHFSFVGDVEKVINTAEYPYCTFYGNIRNPEEMNRIYRMSDVLILTSSYEGLPLVVMQMMAHGKVVLSTAINAIPDYISHMINGLLITATKEEDIIQEGAELLQLLVDDPSLKTRLGLRSRELAIEKFNGALFCREYRTLMNLPEKSC